jgi:hypothetical protein
LTTTNDTKLLEAYNESLEEQLHGWGEVTVVAKIQRKAGLLRGPWPGAYREYKKKGSCSWDWSRDFPMRSEEYEKRDILPMIGLSDAINVLIEMRINQAQCSHEQKEETGESIPMGSFTARPLRCQRCGLKFRND